MSVLLRPDCKPEEMMHLTCCVAVAVCNAIERIAGIHPQIKWVNDIVWNGKKLGGILTGLSVDQTTGRVNWSIVGIGINCSTTAFPPELQSIATSLSLVNGKAVDRAALAAELIRQLAVMEKDFLEKRSAYMDEYRKNCVVIGRQVQLLRGDEKRDAFVLGIDDQGALIVRLADGSHEVIQSGEVSLRGVDGYAP
jgi:BirA family biotin operon repressor/biotin-[acetyl-CoA-carboxylase] ligase